MTADGRIVYGGKTYSLQGIGSQVKQILSTDPEAPVIIQGDNLANHGLVQQVHGQCKSADATLISVSSKS